MTEPAFVKSIRKLFVPYMLRPLALCGILALDNYRKLAAFKGKHNGRRCFIIGNGPSLEIKDLERLENEITFASNKIYLAFDQTQWRPTYYSAVDKLIINREYKKLNELNKITTFFPYFFQKYDVHFDNSIYFYFIHKEFYPDLPLFGINPIYRLFSGHTVTYILLQLAVYMGIKEIYLIGVDYCYNIYQQDYSDNEKILVSDGTVSHFHPEYVKSGDKVFQPNLHLHEKAYISAGHALEKSGGRIFNATRGGKLDLFPRVDFDKIIYAGGK
ncbi:MAG: DUF115 domain-containing protein [Proteobacteria bacterium]|nr:DUF115 domain-containing protein [Pseudomonadota bacterium]